MNILGIAPMTSEDHIRCKEAKAERRAISEERRGSAKTIYIAFNEKSRNKVVSKGCLNERQICQKSRRTVLVNDSQD